MTTPSVMYPCSKISPYDIWSSVLRQVNIDTIIAYVRRRLWTLLRCLDEKKCGSHSIYRNKSNYFDREVLII